MKSVRQEQGSVAGPVIATLVVLAVAVFAGLRLNQERTRLAAEVEALRSELTTAQTRVAELEKHVGTERAAREQAQAAARDAADAAVQAREELQAQQEALGRRIEELEGGIREHEQRVAAAEQAKAQLEADLARELEQTKSVQAEIAGLRRQLQEQEALLGQQPTAGPTTDAAGAPPPAAAADDTVPPATAGTAAKQRFPDEAAPPAEDRTAFDTPPRPLDLVTPEYPASLRRDGTEGNVLVAFTVDTRGRVQDVEVREATNREFETAAVEAVRQWRFKPALHDGEPVEVRISQRLNFTAD